MSIATIAAISETTFGMSKPHIFAVMNPTIVITIADIIIDVMFIMNILHLPDFQLSLISCGYIFNFVPFDFSYYWAHYLIFIMENDIKAFRFLFYVTYLGKN